MVLISPNIVDFIGKADKIMVKNKLDVRGLVEKAFKIGQDDVENLFVLKYHLEKEISESSDKSLTLINKLIDIYSKGSMYELEKIHSLNELFSDKSIARLELSKLERVLKINSGVVLSGIVEATYDKAGLLKNAIKAIIMEPDDSIVYQPRSNNELDWFESEIFEIYSIHFSRERSNEVKYCIAMLRSNNVFNGDTNEVICITGRRDGEVTFTMFGEKFIVPADEEVFQNIELEDKGVMYSVWLI